MNREIKFRAWIPEEKRMEHLEFHITAYGETISFGHEKHDWIIMQFTGLHDRNGKEIYEGDICLYSLDEFSERKMVRIEYREELAAFAMIGLQDWPCLLAHYYKHNRYLEVIGNTIPDDLEGKG